jgi:hypothetical protein
MTIAGTACGIVNTTEGVDDPQCGAGDEAPFTGRLLVAPVFRPGLGYTHR